MENIALIKRDDLEALARSLAERVNPVNDEVLDAKGAAQLLGLSYAQVISLAASGEMPARNVWPGGSRESYRFSRLAILEWVRSHSNNSSALSTTSSPKPFR